MLNGCILNFLKINSILIPVKTITVIPVARAKPFILKKGIKVRFKTIANTKEIATNHVKYL